MALTVVKPSGIDTTGNFTVNGMTVSANLSAANANIANLVTTGNINFAGVSNVNLGAVGNIHISGGTANYVLQTDGAGNLSWVAQSGGSGGTPGGANTQIQFNDDGTFGGNANLTFDKATSVLTITGNISSLNANLGNLAVANFFSGSGNLLSNIQGANVSGAVANATQAVTANTVTTAAQPNITSVGLLTALSVGPNSGITLTGTSGYVRANSIQGTDGVAALYPAYGGVTGAAGVVSDLTVGIGAAGNVTANGNVTASYFIGNGSSLSSITGANVTGQVANALIAGTVTTSAQPDITSVGTLTGLTSNGTVNFVGASNVSLGAIGNVKITGGTSGQYLITDGAGNLSFTTLSVSSSSISNGNSNVNIPAANGNVNISSAGNANVVVVTGTGVNVAGTLNVTGVSNLGPASNVKITGGTNGYVLSTDGVGNLSWVAQSNGGGSSNAANIIVDSFTGNGVQTTFTLSTTPNNINYTSVNYNGATLLRSSYTLSGANITFTEAPANGYSVEVTTVGLATGGANITISDEGTMLTNAVASINFVGNGVTATNSGNAVTVTVSGGSSGGINQATTIVLGMIFN